MRLLLSPIAEEPEMSETQQSHAADSQQELNKYKVEELLPCQTLNGFFSFTKKGL